MATETAGREVTTHRQKGLSATFTPRNSKCRGAPDPMLPDLFVQRRCDLTRKRQAWRGIRTN
eukprot:2873935-Pleurochrysis_carterae.AAC.1